MWYNSGSKKLFTRVQEKYDEVVYKFSFAWFSLCDSGRGHFFETWLIIFEEINSVNSSHGVFSNTLCGIYSKHEADGVLCIIL